MDQRPASRVPWIVLGMLVLISATSLGWGLGSRRHADDNESLQRRLQALEADQARPRVARDQVSGLIGSGVPGSEWAAGPGQGLPATPADDPPSPEAITRQRADEISALEQRLAADGHDARWSPEMEVTTQVAALEPALQAFTAPRSSNVYCGRSICRLVFMFAHAGQAADWSDFYPTGLASTLPATQSYQTVLADGSVELRMYAFRHGAQAMEAATGR